MLVKSVRAFDKTLDVVAIIFFLLLLFIGMYSLLDNLWLYDNATDETLLHYKPELNEPLTEEKLITENQVAWISLYATDIDYPIMQAEDNVEYLNKNPYGEFSLSGSIFLDSRNSADFKDPISLVYGHHMEHGAMFGALDEYADKTYFDGHRNGTLSTTTDVFQIEIFVAISDSALNDILFNPYDHTREELIDYLKMNAVNFDAPAENRPILILSTCAGSADVSRFLVIGTLSGGAG